MEASATTHEGFQLVAKSRKRRCHDEQDPRNIIEGKRKRVESEKLALSHGNQKASGIRKAITATSSPSIQTANRFDLLSDDDKSCSDNEAANLSDGHSSTGEESDVSIVEVEVCPITSGILKRHDIDPLNKASSQDSPISCKEATEASCKYVIHTHIQYL